MTYLQIVATIQDFDPKTKSTRFDEPVGIAFAGNKKAYVALSSENEVAVIDVPSRSISKRLKIPAQDPRAIVVRNERLYVVPFEPNNKTQLSGGRGEEGIKGDGGNSVRHDGCVTSGFISFLKFPTTIDGYGIRFLACRGVGN